MLRFPLNGKWLKKISIEWKNRYAGNMSRTSLFRMSSAITVSLFVSAVHAEPHPLSAERVQHLPPVVVSARAWPEPLDHLPVSVAIWQPDADLWGMAGGMADLAITTPGVDRTSDGPWASDLSIRGLSGDRIVITLDGARLMTANDLAARMALLDLGAVDRIEIFKGPVSALSGSGSLGGVVNIVLRAPEYSVQPVRRQQVRLGGMHNPDGWVARYLVMQSGPTYFSEAAIMARDADSYRDGDGNRVRNTQYEDRAVSVRMGYRWAENMDSYLLVQIHRGNEIGIPGTGSAPLPAAADVTYEDADRVLVGMNHRWLLDGNYWRSSRLHLYYQLIERTVRMDRFPAGPVRQIKPVGRHDTWGARWLNEVEVGEHLIGAGLETWRRELDSTRTRYLRNGQTVRERPLPESSEWSYGAFIEDRWSIHPDFSLTAGGRMDGLRVENRSTPQWPSGSRDDWNWNAHTGFRWHASEHGALRAVTAAGYRSASLEERYQVLTFGDGRTKLGNPDLDAEESLFAEVGWEWQRTEWSATISAFWNELRNRIGEERVDEFTLRNANIDLARIQGVEVEASWRIRDPLELHASLAYVRGDDRRADQPLPDIAPLTHTASLQYRPTTAWLMRLRYVYADRQNRVPDNMASTPSWGRLDASLAYILNQGTVEHELRLDVLNATDTTYRDHLSTWRGSPHNEPGRSLQIAWHCRF